MAVPVTTACAPASPGKSWRLNRTSDSRKRSGAVSVGQIVESSGEQRPESSSVGGVDGGPGAGVVGSEGICAPGVMVIVDAGICTGTPGCKVKYVAESGAGGAGDGVGVGVGAGAGVWVGDGDGDGVGDGDGGTGGVMGGLGGARWLGNQPSSRARLRRDPTPIPPSARAPPCTLH